MNPIFKRRKLARDKFEQGEIARLELALNEMDNANNNLQITIQTDRSLLRDIRQENSKLKEEIANAKKLTAPYCSLFPPDMFPIAGKERDTIFLHKSLMQDPEQALEFVALHVMLANLRDDTLSGSKHVMVSFAGNRWGYAISPQAIFITPEYELLKIVSASLAHLITPYIKELYSERKKSY